MADTGAWTVFLAALVTALATGLGAVPLLVLRRPSPRWSALGNAVAAGLMLAASLGLLREGLLRAPPETLLGAVLGAVLMWGGHRLAQTRPDLHVGALSGSDARKALLIVGVMTLHSAAEGIGVGVSFGGGAELGLVMTLAIALHNVPEGLAISLVLVPRGVSVLAAGGWSVFSSLPQPILAVPAFLFVALFAPLLPVGLGLAAGAMVWMVALEILPEARATLGTPRVAATVVLAAAGMLVLGWAVGGA